MSRLSAEEISSFWKFLHLSLWVRQREQDKPYHLIRSLEPDSAANYITRWANICLPRGHIVLHCKWGLCTSRLAGPSLADSKSFSTRVFMVWTPLRNPLCKMALEWPIVLYNLSAFLSNCCGYLIHFKQCPEHMVSAPFISRIYLCWCVGSITVQIINNQE